MTSNPSGNPSSPIFRCEQWEVWQVVWKHEDGTEKARPVLILSSTQHNSKGQGIWVAKFTKTLKQQPHRIEFSKADASFRSTGLTDTCHLYLKEARTIDHTLLIKRRGHLNSFNAMIIAIEMKRAIKFPMP
jgi:mRNA-degrading endonuclease toxin of MazEF toxin-antitoxin module